MGLTLFDGYVAQRRRATELGWKVAGDGKTYCPVHAKEKREDSE